MAFTLSCTEALFKVRACGVLHMCLSNDVLSHVQGTFVECCGAAPVTSKMAACVLELVRSQGVHGHAQPYVRRSALLASAQVCSRHD